MKITIIIPIYQVENYVVSCMQSVMDQSYSGDVECILVDDCGGDNSMPIAERFISQYSGNIKFRIIHHRKNRGLSAARNTGIVAATGDYILFLDSDDTLAPDGIENLISPIKSKDYDVVVGDFRVIADGKELPRYSMNLQLEDGTVLKDEDIIHSYRKSWNMMAQNKLYRLDFIKGNNLRFKEGLIHEDELWSFEVACLAKSLYAVNKVTYNYQKREGSLTDRESSDIRYLHLSEVVREMGAFARDRNIYNKSIHLRIDSILIRVLGYYSGTLSEYVSVYSRMTKNTKPTGKLLFKALGWDVKWYFMDFHYFLPDNIAPYWMYYTFSKPLSYLGILKK